MSNADVYTRLTCPRCQKTFKVKSALVGKRFCPNCGIHISTATQPAPVAPDSATNLYLETQTRRRTERAMRQARGGALEEPSSDGIPPTGMMALLVGMVVVWSGGIIPIILLTILFQWHIAAPLSLIGVWSAFVLSCVIRLLLAKAAVLRKGSQEVDLFFGLVKLVAWNPNEGVVLLRSKAVSHVDDNPYDGGGMKVIYPILGDEVALRVPLERHPLEFIDKEVLTREFLPLKMRGMMEWEVSNIEDFFLHVGEEVQGLSDTRAHFDERPGTAPIPYATFANPKIEVAKHLLALKAEEVTRRVVAQAPTGLLVARQIVDGLSPDLRKQVQDGEPQGALAPTTGPPLSSDNYQKATESLSKDIEDEIVPLMQQYGITVRRVALQEVNLPPEIYEAAKQACVAQYLPMKAQAQAMARKIEILGEGAGVAGARKAYLQAEADVIGRRTVGTREVVGAAPAFTLVDFLTQFLGEFAQSYRKRATPPPL